MLDVISLYLFFFFNDTATTEIYTLSLHDALPIYRPRRLPDALLVLYQREPHMPFTHRTESDPRSEEHTSELQSQSNLVCRLLLEKKKKKIAGPHYETIRILHIQRDQRLSARLASV